MTIQQFVSQSFKKISKEFSQAFIAYQFDAEVGTHYIKVSPPDIYENDAFVDLQWELIDSFDAAFPNDELCFLTDDSLIQLTSPSRIFYPDWGEEVFIEEGKLFVSKSFESDAETNRNEPSLGTNKDLELSTFTENSYLGNYQYAMAA